MSTHQRKGTLALIFAALLLEPLLNPVWTFLAHGEVPGMWATVGGTIILGAITFQAVVPKRQGSSVPGPGAEETVRRSDAETR